MTALYPPDPDADDWRRPTAEDDSAPSPPLPLAYCVACEAEVRGWPLEDDEPETMRRAA